MMANQLRDVGKKPELVIYPKLDHYLEDSAVRTEMLEKSSTFLKTQLQIK
jgi:dipeptidyl aminopeptidase/acylaminoacyl peptidase